MISTVSMKKRDSDSYEFELKGLSSDEKPSVFGNFHIAINSIFLELDTGDFYYLETPVVWKKIGGGGSPSGEPLVEIKIDEWFGSYGSASYYEYTTDVDLPDNITVDWNGTPYQCTNGSTDEYLKGYGAQWDDTIEGYDFSEYPFRISYSLDPESDDFVYYIYAESSDLPVTVKIYG